MTCSAGTGRTMVATSCGCKPGYYDDTTNVNCKSCTYPCAECANSATNCTTCKTTANRVADCGCASKFYETGS